MADTMGCNQEEAHTMPGPSDLTSIQDMEQDNEIKRRETASVEDVDEEVPLSPYLQDALQRLQARRQAIDLQVAQLKEDAIMILDNLKEAIITKMDRVLEECDEYQATQRQSWLDTAAESKDIEEKLEQVGTFIAQLKVHSPPKGTLT